MMNVLNFLPGDLVPAEPGNYLVIGQDMQYHHCSAEFIEGEFARFVSRQNQTIPNLDVLAHARIKPAAVVVQGIYSQPQKPALALVGGAAESV